MRDWRATIVSFRLASSQILADEAGEQPREGIRNIFDNPTCATFSLGTHCGTPLLLNRQDVSFEVSPSAL